MNYSFCIFGITGRFAVIALTIILVFNTCIVSPAAQPQHRGIWMHANYIKTQVEADRCVDMLQRANFNAVYLLVWYWGGQVSFQSQLCPMLEGVQLGYDPLGYLIQECHRRQIEVHAWFVNGYYGNPKPLHVLDQHPDWAVDSGGESDLLWYDLGKPQVRKFESDLMIEALTRYDLDGIHFDYIRYSEHAMCYCESCQTEFASRYGCGSFQQLKRKSFPFASTITGDPVTRSTTARILAQFSDGTPAIAINELGKGKVLLFNWRALRSPLPPVVETLTRTLRHWNVACDKVFIMDTEPNRQRYGGKGTSEAVETFCKLGYGAAITAEDRLNKLSPGSLVVLDNVFLIPDDFAQSLEQFVCRGGLLVVINGPVHSIRNASIQRVLGMSQVAKNIQRIEVIQPVGTSDLLLCEDLKIDLEQLNLKKAKWSEYRKSGVTELVRDVYQRAKNVKPRAKVTAAVFASLASADSVFQDWPGWIRQGIVDYVIPMAYTPKDDVLARQLQEWITVDPQLERILPGLSIYTKGKEEDSCITRDNDTILAQYRMCMIKGARGINFFSLDGTAAKPVLLLNESLITVLRDGPFAGKVPVYYPPVYPAKK